MARRALLVDNGGWLTPQVEAVFSGLTDYSYESVAIEQVCELLETGDFDFALIGDCGAPCFDLIRNCRARCVVQVPFLYCCETIDKETIDHAFEAGANEVARLAELDAAGFARLVDQLFERAEQRLLIDRMLRSVINLVPNMIYAKDRQGYYLFANQATADFYGVPIEHLNGSNQSQWHVDPDELARFIEEDRQVIELGRRLEQITDHLTTADGVHHVIETTKVPLDLDDHGHRAVLGVSRDITDKHRLEQNVGRLMAALDSAGDMVIVTALDGTIEYVNPAFETITGYTAEEAIGQKPSLIKSGMHDTSFYEEMWSIILSGEVFRSTIINRRKDGDLFEVEETITSVKDQNGNMFGFVTFGRDVTEKRQAEYALKDSEERFALAAEGSHDGLWDWDIATDRLYLSPRAYEMLGFAPDSEAIQISKDFWELLDEETRADMEKRIKRHLKKVTLYFDATFRFVAPDDGKERWLQARGVARRNEAGWAIRMAGSLSDITRFKQSEIELKAMSLRDQLTGLPNRKMFINHLTSAINAADTHGNYMAAVLFVGLNKLKEVKTSMGDTLGDRLLVKVARRLRDVVRPTDVIAHLGVGEFAFLLPHLVSLKSAELMAERIESCMAEPFHEEGQNIKVTVSTGITVIDRNSARVPDYILRDAALAQRMASHSSENVVLFDQSMHENAVRRLRLESEMDTALQEQQFMLYLQPIMDLQRGGLSGFEALIRWNHPEQGMVPPDQFIQIAEETGQISAIGQWVLQKADEVLCRWQSDFNLRRELYISVNLSPVQLKDNATVELIAHLLAKAPYDHSQLRIEITESAIIDDADRAREQLMLLKQTGALLYLDDFGTGYSSLSYLSNFPFDVLKVDQSFTRDIDSDFSKRKITESIIQLADHLEMRVVAEGVETETHMNLLKGMGCDYGQGYLFSRPLPPDELEGYIDQQSGSAHA